MFKDASGKQFFFSLLLRNFKEIYLEFQKFGLLYKTSNMLVVVLIGIVSLSAQTHLRFYVMSDFNLSRFLNIAHILSF